MTVAELIEQLAKHPSDAIVAISFSDADYEVTALHTTKVSSVLGNTAGLLAPDPSDEGANCVVLS